MYTTAHTVAEVEASRLTSGITYATILTHMTRHMLSVRDYGAKSKV